MLALIRSISGLPLGRVFDLAGGLELRLHLLHGFLRADGLEELESGLVDEPCPRRSLSTGTSPHWSGRLPLHPRAPWERRGHRTVPGWARQRGVRRRRRGTGWSSTLDLLEYEELRVTASPSAAAAAVAEATRFLLQVRAEGLRASSTRRRLGKGSRRHARLHPGAGAHIRGGRALADPERQLTKATSAHAEPVQAGASISILFDGLHAVVDGGLLQLDVGAKPSPAAHERIHLRRQTRRVERLSQRRIPPSKRAKMQATKSC